MAILEDELATIKLKKQNAAREPTFQMVKNEEHITNLIEFLSQIKGLIEDFGVRCSKISDKSYQITKKKDTVSYSKCFRILGNKQNIINFKERIGFRFNSNKKKELESCYISIVKNMRGRGFEPR